MSVLARRPSSSAMLTFDLDISVRVLISVGELSVLVIGVVHDVSVSVHPGRVARDDLSFIAIVDDFLRRRQILRPSCRRMEGPTSFGVRSLSNCRNGPLEMYLALRLSLFPRFVGLLMEVSESEAACCQCRSPAVRSSPCIPLSARSLAFFMAWMTSEYTARSPILEGAV